MDIGEQILLFLSRTPGSEDYVTGGGETSSEKALDLLTRVYPNLDAIVSGKRVADFGCGAGYQSVALCTRYNCSVIGIDSNRKTLGKAIEHARSHNIPSDRLSFVETVTESMANTFDVVISQNSFEHFGNPAKVLDDMRKLINDSGTILITFCPPWLAPYGSHMHFFCKIPWIHILFPERVVMKVRSRFRDDGAKRYEDVESGLNKMTVAKFENIIATNNLEIVYRNYKCIKGMDFLSRLPFLREFFINVVAVMLANPHGLKK